MEITDRRLRDIYPKSLMPNNDCRLIEFDNRFDLLNFIDKHEAHSSSQQGNTEEFLEDLESYTPDQTEVDLIASEVKNNLIKRGIITGTVYEGIKYDVEGETIDHAELASGSPMCMITQKKKYDSYFYELYLNMSISGSVSEETVTRGAIRLIETIKALRELNIEIKVNVVDYAEKLYYENDEGLKDLLIIIPLISHLEDKNYRNLMPYIKASFLRGPLFTIAWNSIEDDTKVNDSMGCALKLINCVNLSDLANSGEVELAERVLMDLGLKDK